MSSVAQHMKLPRVMLATSIVWCLQSSDASASDPVSCQCAGKAAGLSTWVTSSVSRLNGVSRFWLQTVPTPVVLGSEPVDEFPLQKKMNTLLK